MKTLFISSIVDNRTFDNIIKKSRSKPSIAGQRFERLIAEGLNEVGKIELLSYLPLPSFPSIKKLFVRYQITKYKNIKLTYMPMFNALLFKQIFIMMFTFVYTLIWGLKNRREKTNFLLNVVYIPTALPALGVAKLLKIPIIVLVPDVSSYRFDYTETKSTIKKALTLMYKKATEKIDTQFDGYIFLTEAMNDLMNKRNKPYIIIEGMIPIENNKLQDGKLSLNKNDDKMSIMYAGTLRKKYGVLKLIKAFLKIEEKNIELWIFGSGDQESEIKKLADGNQKIKFFGLRPQGEIFQYEKSATLLVNPRPSTEEYTKYSFPSKTLEYMSSGTPFLTTKLPGIPQEYYQYIFYFKEESINGIKKQIENVLSKESKELEQIGKDAKEYVLKNKNNFIQSKRIYSFFKKNNLFKL